MSDKRLVLWGTADLGKPRTRILLQGLQSESVVVAECLVNPWAGVEDKSQIRGLAKRFSMLLRFLWVYPFLIWRYLRAPKHDGVVVSYMGHLDVIILWPFAKLRGAKIVWDAFLSLYDTIVDDRKLIKANSAVAKLVSILEKLSCMAADIIILDTDKHADYFQKRYAIPEEKLMTVWVGAEDCFSPQPMKNQHRDNGGDFQVLFYGQYIPLHGIEHIIDAACQLKDDRVHWTLIGHGQQAEKIKRLARECSLGKLTFVDWVAYEQLPEMIGKADLCLGIFGDSAKASRVIPNKVFQIIACGKPLVTRDSPAIREIISPEMPGVWLVAPGSGTAIAEAVRAAKGEITTDPDQFAEPLHISQRARISAFAIGRHFTEQLHNRV